MSYTLIFVAICGASAFAAMARHERKSPLLWGSASFAVSAIAGYFGAGWLGLVVAQALLYAGITVYRVVTEPVVKINDD